MKRVSKIRKGKITLDDVLLEIRNTNQNLENLAISSGKQFSTIIEKLNEHDKRFDEHDKSFEEIKITELKQEVEIAHIHTLLGEMNKREEKQDDKIANNFYLAKEIEALSKRITKLEENR